MNLSTPRHFHAFTFRPKTIAMRLLPLFVICLFLASCGAVYQSPSVQQMAGDETNIRVLPMSAENILFANSRPYTPRDLPAIFSQTAGTGGGLRGAGTLPAPVFDETSRPASVEMRLPPPLEQEPYRIGISDVIVLATPQTGTTVGELTGLLAAQARRQGYTVQDDGTIAIPGVGRVPLAGLSLEQAESELFQRLVENQIDPTFSLEISEFNSRRVSIGGAVARPTVLTIGLTPLTLDEALVSVGGVTGRDDPYATIRLYRDGTLYQIPLDRVVAGGAAARLPLRAGDSLFVDSEFGLDAAQSYFEEQIKLIELRQSARLAALQELNIEIGLRRAALAEARTNFQTRLEAGAEARDHVYLTGEVLRQGRFTLPFGQKATLADALYTQAGGVPTETGNISQIYVLRGSDDPREFGAVTAWRLDARNAANFVLATRFELRPNDVIFVAEQPVTRWGRVIRQITPSLLTTSLNSTIR